MILKDLIISVKEAVNDKDNIFGLKPNANADRLEKIQASVNKELELTDIRGLEKGIETNKYVWAIAKPIILQYMDKGNLTNMFSNKAAVEYYSEKIGKNSETNKHLVELFKARNLTIDEIKNMGFSQDVLKDLLKWYMQTK